MKKSLLLILVCAIGIISVHGQEKDCPIDLELRDKLLPLVNRAKNLNSKKEFEKAIFILLQVNKSDSLIKDVYHELFKAALHSKNLSDSVVDCLQTGNRVFNEDDEISFFVAEICLRRDEFSKAISQFSAAIEFSKSIPEKSFYYPDYYKGRAYCYAKLKNYNAAITDYSEYLMYNKKDAIIYLNRAICFKNLGCKTKALEDFKMSFNLGNKSAQQYIDKLSKKP